MPEGKGMSPENHPHIARAINREDRIVKEAQDQLGELTLNTFRRKVIKKKLESEIRDHSRLANQIRGEFEIPQKYPKTTPPQETNTDNPNNLPTHVLTAIEGHEEQKLGFVERMAEINKRSRSKEERSRKTNRARAGMQKVRRLTNQIRSEFGIPPNHPVRKPIPNK